jgi:transposase
VRRAYEQDDTAVRRWLQEEYPAIRAAAKKEKALIYWGDEMGLRSDHHAGRSYAPRGQTPAIPGTGQRFGCNVLSALTNRGHLDFMVFQKGFTAAVFLRFLRRLITQVDRKLFFIVDRHPVHRSRNVRAGLEHNAKHIRLFFLPGYSPELNPDEMVNQDVKTNAVGKKRAHNRPQLISNVRRYLQKRRACPELVIHYFHEESVRYAAQ